MAEEKPKFGIWFVAVGAIVATLIFLYLKGCAGPF